MSTCIFRTAHAGEAATIAALHAESWRSAYRGLLPDAYLDRTVHAERLAHWQARLAADASPACEVLLAEVDGAPAGFMCLIPDAEPENGIYLDNLHVLPAWQGLGLGRALMARAARRTRLLAPGRPLFLYVIETNHQARQCYLRWGGQETGRLMAELPGPCQLPVLRIAWPDPSVAEVLAETGDL